MKRKIFLPLILSLVCLSGFQAAAQSQLPLVSVRFANPYYDCPTQTYCLDVEFLANTENLQLFGMNVRFFYDDDILEFLAIGDTAQGYGSLNLPTFETYADQSSRAFFGFDGPVEWVNGEIQLKDNSQPIPLSTNDSNWTKLFNVCFHVDDPDSRNIKDFCPSVVWDLQEFPPESGFLGGYLQGDDGVVITIVTTYPDSGPVTEEVVQFNWSYDGTPLSPAGYPDPTVCIPTTCGYVIPLSNWALVLAIGLMLVASVFIYRRRMS